MPVSFLQVQQSHSKSENVRLCICYAPFPCILHVVRCALKAAIASSHHANCQLNLAWTDDEPYYALKRVTEGRSLDLDLRKASWPQQEAGFT